MKGLLKSAMRDGNLVLCFDDITLLGRSGEVSDGEYTIPHGTCDIKRVGSDLTIVAVAGAVHHSLSAARILEDQGISVEVVDIRSVVPLDRQTILESVAKTGRLVVVDRALGTCSVASEVAATVVEHILARLKAPIVQFTAPDVPIPFCPYLERLMYPTTERIAAAARKLCEFR